MDANQTNNPTVNQPGGSPPAAPSQPEADLSKTTIAILVLLTLMISIIGTWTVLNEISNVRIAQPKPSSTTGTVNLNIVAPNANSAPEPQTAYATGNAIFQILR